MVMRAFERRLERLVEGGFARAFRSAVRPVELGRRLIRVIDDERTVDVNGQMTAPNAFTVWLSAVDLERFTAMDAALRNELEELAREHARSRQYRFVGYVTVTLANDQRFREGRFEISASFEAPEVGGLPGSLRMPDGTRVQVGTGVVVGRSSDTDIVIDDPRVSRRHAAIAPHGLTFRLEDNASTNGTRVNGVPVTNHELNDGDVIEIGGREIVFEAS